MSVFRNIFESLGALLLLFVVFLIATFPVTWLLMLFLGNVGANVSYWGALTPRHCGQLADRRGVLGRISARHRERTTRRVAVAPDRAHPATTSLAYYQAETARLCRCLR
jgi:hypothetical protein